jgi:hypothetical protein
MENSKKFIISSPIVMGDYGGDKTNGSRDGKDVGVK